MTDWWAYYKLEPWDLSRVEDIVAHAVGAVLSKQAQDKDLYPVLHRDFRYQQQQKDKRAVARRMRKKNKPEASRTNPLYEFFKRLAGMNDKPKE